MVVEDDDADHHPHAEEEGLGVGEAAPVLPVPGEGLAEPWGVAQGPPRCPPCVWGTHGVSSITLQTQAMVLRQSVVSSIGSVLF